MRLEFVDPIQLELVDYIKTKAETLHCPVFRFYTLLMYGVPVEGLIPLPNIMQYLRDCNFGDSNTLEFDKAYASQLLMYNKSFVDLMKIMTTLQFCDTTIIITNYTHPLATPIIDSLIKFIQQRYSIQSYIVNDIMDIDNFAVSDFESNEGYTNLIKDIDRFKAITSNPNSILKEGELNAYL